MNISEIYTKYKIMPSLQLHMYRVSGVAAFISDNMKIDIDRNSIIGAALLHDMGNIIKFKMDLFPEFLEPEGVEYWQNVQNEYFEKYGHDEHHATIEIAKEIGVSDRIMNLLNTIGFTKMNRTYESQDFNLKIAAYSDMRVEPHGVVSLEYRVQEGRNRNRHRQQGFGDDTLFERMAGFLKKIETQIFENASIKPEDISDEAVEKYFNELKTFNLFK